MRVRADEHISPEIVRAVRDIALSPDWNLSHVFDDGHGGADDVTWITKFARDGGHAILSADADFVKRPHQVTAVCDLGLRVVNMPGKWANSVRHVQAAHILFWWKRIEETIAKGKPRECWRVPWGFSEIGGLRTLKVDYGKARKKVKKSLKKSG